MKHLCLIKHNQTYHYQHNADTIRLEVKIQIFTSWTIQYLSLYNKTKHYNGGKVDVNCWAV